VGGRTALKADNLTAIFEPIVYEKPGPLRLTTRVSTTYPTPLTYLYKLVIWDAVDTSIWMYLQYVECNGIDPIVTAHARVRKSSAGDIAMIDRRILWNRSSIKISRVFTAENVQILVFCFVTTYTLTGTSERTCFCCLQNKRDFCPEDGSRTFSQNICNSTSKNTTNLKSEKYVFCVSRLYAWKIMSDNRIHFYVHLMLRHT
jgi:hypothetical protein